MSYEFKVGAGAWYPQDNYADFIRNQVRTRLNPIGGQFTLSMRDTGNNQTVDIQVQAADLYITGFQARPIPAPLLNYAESAVLINRNSIDTAFADAFAFTGAQTPETSNTVRVLPFIFAEAARFPIVNYAVGRVLDENVNATYHWEDFRDIIRNWQVLCNWAAQQNLVPGDATFGSNGKFAPVEPNVIQSYNQHHGAGLKIPSGVGM